ncbi:MAG TPA: hypothetical protein VE596_13815 [Gaiellaceae bacterium]|nr:hypothetical protein [Gaiellaceae bacterium]
MPPRSGRVPSVWRPYRPSAARVMGPATPSTGRCTRRWNARTAAAVVGPATPSIVAE